MSGLASHHAGIFIIGAGPAGLTAAYCLTREARSVIVIEKDPIHVGGLSRTVRYKDFLLDIGSHRFSSEAKEIVDLWQEILPDDFVTRPRRSRIFYGGKFYSCPLNAFEALRKLGLANSVRCLISYAKARMRPIAQPQSFHHWVRNRFGEKLFRIFFKTYTEKVWGLSCDEIPADEAAQRIRGLDLTVALKNALMHSLNLMPEASDEAAHKPTETFRYPRKGAGMMWEAAAKKIRECGGRLLMGRALERLSFDETRNLWTIEVSTAHGTETYTADHVVSSAPVGDLMERLAPRPISLFHARALRYRDFITVALMVRKPELFSDNVIYIHDPSVKVSRVRNFRAWSPELAPAGMSCLGLEYFCFEGDGLWSAPDEELIACAGKEIARIGLAAAADIVDGTVVRQPKAYPLQDDDCRHNMAMIRLDLETHYPTLHLVGCNGMHKHNNQDHAMMTALLTARNILAGARRYDVWDINEDAAYREADASGIGPARGRERQVPEKAAADAA